MITNTGDLNDDETKLEQENPNMETQEGQGKNKETRVQNPDTVLPLCPFMSYICCMFYYVGQGSYFDVKV